MKDWLKHVLDELVQGRLQVTDLPDDFRHWLYACGPVETLWKKEGFQESDIQEGYLSLRVSIGLLYLIRKALKQHRSSAPILGGLLLILARYVYPAWQNGTRPMMEEAAQNLVNTEWLQKVVEDAEIVEVIRQRIKYPISRSQAYVWIEKGREVLQEAIDAELRASVKGQGEKQRRRAAGYYKRLLEERHQRIHVAGLSCRLLKDVFVAMPLRRVRFDEGKGWEEGGYFVPEDLWGQQRVVLEGPSGGGKTTLLKYLAWQWAREEDRASQPEQRRKPWPVPMIISDVKAYLEVRGEVEPLEYALQELLRGTEASVEERIELRRYLEGEKKIYLLDGGDQAVERRGELHRLLETLPRWVLSMRDAVRVGRYLAGMQVVRLEPWTESQLRAYLSRLCRGEESEIEKRVHTIHHLEVQGELTRWPLWVALIGTEKDQAIHLPDLVSRGLKRWFERGKRPSVEQDEILRKLKKLSWASYVSSLGDRGWLWEGQPAREKWALRRAAEVGLLQLSGQGRYRFVHEVFRSYLAARAMVGRADIEGAVRELVGRPRWQEVMYWAGQLLAEEDSARMEAWGRALVTALDDTLLTTGWLEAADLVGQMYRAAPAVWSEWRKQAVERVWEWWRSSSASPLSSLYELHEAAVNALAALEAVEKIPYLQMDRWDGWWERSAIRTIGRIGGAEGFAALREMVSDMDARRRSSECRSDAVGAVGALRGGDEAGIVAWLVQRINDGLDQKVAVRGLGRRGSELSLRALLDLGHERGTTLSSFCRRVIAEEWNGPPGAIVQALERTIEDKDIYLIKVLAQAVQRLQIVEAVPLLMKALRRGHLGVAEGVVREAVRQLGGVELLDVLKTWVWESERRRAEEPGLRAAETEGRGTWASNVLPSVMSYLPVSELGCIIFDEEKPDWLRGAAVRALSGKDCQAAVRIGRRIVEQEGEELAWGVYLLARGHDTASLQRLRTLISHPDEVVRQQAADAVATLGDEEAGPLLARQLMEERDKEARRRQIWALEKLGAREGVPALAKVARQCAEDWHGMELAMRALGRLGGAEAVAALLALWEEAELETEEEIICQALADTGREEAVKRLLAAARRGDRAARSALEGVQSREALPVLLAGMEDDDPEVREACVRGVGRIEDARVLPGLLTAVMDEDQWVREAAEQELERRLRPGVKVERPEVCRWLEETLTSPEGKVRRWAASWLGCAVPWNVSAEGQRRLQDMVQKDPDGGARAAAARALGALKVVAARSVLLTALRDDEDEGVCRAALAGLIQLNQAEDDELLLAFALECIGKIEAYHPRAELGGWRSHTRARRTPPCPRGGLWTGPISHTGCLLGCLNWPGQVLP